MAERPQQTPHQRGLAGTELSGQVQHAAGPGLRGKRGAERKRGSLTGERDVKMRRHGLRVARR